MMGYAVFAFIFGLALTPWFVSFLRRNKVGKQLRVEAVDGREATVFRTYHQHKFGTPTMGGLLIWGSILASVLFSRLLSLSAVVEHSLLQRGQVYVPLFVMVSLGLLGAFDDYLNMIGAGKRRASIGCQNLLHSFLSVVLPLHGFILNWDMTKLMSPSMEQ